MNYSELLQLAKGWGNFISGRIIIWRLRIKYAFYEEVADYIGQKQSVLIYNHRSRKQEDAYFRELSEKLGEITGVPESRILKITFPKCSVRDYLAVPASDMHRENIKAAFVSMDQGIWGKTGMCRMPRER